MDDTIIPGLENLMLNVEMMETPRKISPAGNNILGTRTGALPGAVVDKDGRRTSVQTSGVIVSGEGRHLFSSKQWRRVSPPSSTLTYRTCSRVD